mmetsp:Transcript_73692/g.227559  ORF Transcript_73692/g.227559 Transcript_73692/m.227559 type:complete len:294 (+) Transcript_73692:69-950(+)
MHCPERSRAIRSEAEDHLARSLPGPEGPQSLRGLRKRELVAHARRRQLERHQLVRQRRQRLGVVEAVNEVEAHDALVQAWKLKWVHPWPPQPLPCQPDPLQDSQAVGLRRHGGRAVNDVPAAGSHTAEAWLKVVAKHGVQDDVEALGAHRRQRSAQLLLEVSPAHDELLGLQAWEALSDDRQLGGGAHGANYPHAQLQADLDGLETATSRRGVYEDGAASTHGAELPQGIEDGQGLHHEGGSLREGPAGGYLAELVGGDIHVAGVGAEAHGAHDAIPHLEVLGGSLRQVPDLL